jgi:hypothetical protein
MSERREITATLLLWSYFMSAELLGDEFGALLSPTPWSSAFGSAANWAIDRYFENRIAGLNVEAVSDTFWIDEVAPRARRLFNERGTTSVDEFYLAALVAILDDYWTVAPQVIAVDQAPALTQLRDLTRRVLGDPETLSSSVRDTSSSLARAWHSAVERLASSQTST